MLRWDRDYPLDVSSRLYYYFLKTSCQALCVYESLSLSHFHTSPSSHKESIINLFVRHVWDSSAVVARPLCALLERKHMYFPVMVPLKFVSHCLNLLTCHILTLGSTSNKWLWQSAIIVNIRWPLCTRDIDAISHKLTNRLWHPCLIRPHLFSVTRQTPP